MKFMMIDGILLRNRTLQPLDKLIISYIHGFESQGRDCWASEEFMAVELGVSQDAVSKRMSKLIEFDILGRVGNTYVVAQAWHKVVNFSLEGRPA